MGDVLVMLVAIGCLTAILAGLAWLGIRVRRRGADVMGPFEEIWHPAAHRFRAEIRVAEERMVPLPSPEDQARPGPESASESASPRSGTT